MSDSTRSPAGVISSRRMSAGEDGAQHEEGGHADEVQQPDPLVVLRQQPRLEAVAVGQVVGVWRRGGVHGPTSSPVVAGAAAAGGAGAPVAFDGTAFSDLMYSMSCRSPSSLTRPWNVGMIGWNPDTIFARGIHDRLAQVRLVGLDGVAVVERDGLAVQADERRAAARRVFLVAGDAGEVLEQLLARLRHRALAGAAGEPRLVLGALHDHDPAHHAGVVRAAVLGAEEVVPAGLRGLEPQVVYRPGSTSAFTRKAGMYRSWMTSCDVIVSLTDVPTGTCSSLISAWPSGCWNFHIHCLPTT